MKTKDEIRKLAIKFINDLCPTDAGDWINCIVDFAWDQIGGSGVDEYEKTITEFMAKNGFKLTDCRIRWGDWADSELYDKEGGSCMNFSRSEWPCGAIIDRMISLGVKKDRQESYIADNEDFWCIYTVKK